MSGSVPPRIVDLARGERGFLVRVSTANNTHEVARSAAPERRIVYVDNDDR
ncbi:MAG: SAM-dependent methyltransferase [Pseudonocardiaceae bacterium]